MTRFSEKKKVSWHAEMQNIHKFFFTYHIPKKEGGRGTQIWEEVPNVSVFFFNDGTPNKYRVIKSCNGDLGGDGIRIVININKLAF